MNRITFTALIATIILIIVILLAGYNETQCPKEISQTDLSTPKDISLTDSSIPEKYKYPYIPYLLNPTDVSLANLPSIEKYKYPYPLIQYELTVIDGHCQLTLTGAVTDNEGNIWIVEVEEQEEYHE